MCCPPSCGGMNMGGGMPYGGGGFFPPMGAQPAPTMMPVIASIPKPSRPKPPPCTETDTDAKVTAELTLPFLEELNKLGDCKEITASLNGKKYSLMLQCPERKKKSKRRDYSSDSSRDRKKKKKASKTSSNPPGPVFNCCDCNIPPPAGMCQKSDSGSRMKKEKALDKNLSTCLQMMREMFANTYNKQIAADKDAVQMVEIPVMVMPPGGGAMGGMGMMPPSPGMMGGMYPPMGMPPQSYGRRTCKCRTLKRKRPVRSKIVCKTDRDQQCDESALAGKDAGTTTKDAAGGGKKGKGGKKGGKGKKGGGKKGGGKKGGGKKGKKK